MGRWGVWGVWGVWEKIYSLYQIRWNRYTLVTIRQKAPRQRAEGKEQGCKVEGYDKCLAGF
ncbi:MAG: hypothetical protein F6K47_38410, partial [Symploca sp. SIO2E6]|nr:hypothetical protein [Symploca sp. SIO2E6]